MPYRHFPPRPPRPLKRATHLATMAMVALLQRRRKDKDPDRGGVPVEPNRPSTLSGGQRRRWSSTAIRLSDGRLRPVIAADATGTARSVRQA
jgi:hypothetical protein